jgi:hypothetical protein
LKKDEPFEIAYCGVCCKHCGMRGRIPRMAGEMKRFVDAYAYSDWIGNVSSGFDSRDFETGLRWFASSGCRGCLGGGGMPGCSIRIVVRRRNSETAILVLVLDPVIRINIRNRRIE